MAGDLLLEAGHVPVGCSLDLERGFLEKVPGDRVAVTIRRSGSEKQFEIIVAGGTERVVAAASPANLTEEVWKRLGLRATLADPTLVTKANPQLRGGLLINEVDPQGAASKAGIQRGDILVGLHQFETLSLDNISWVLNHQDISSFSPVKFFVIRGGKVHHGILAATGN